MKPEIEYLYSGILSIMLLSMLIWGEARGEIDLGKSAVAWVVRNRVYARRDYGDGWEGVMLKEKQFSCFNDEDVNKERMKEILFTRSMWGKFRECFGIALGVCLGIGDDPTKGATHYTVIGLKPLWRLKMVETVKIGNHVFYKYEDE